MTRLWLPSLSELTDRLSIHTLKSIKLKDKAVYEEESALIMTDIHSLFQEIVKDDRVRDYGKLVRAIQMQAVANEIIWANETKAREGGKAQDYLLPFTHSVNGVRNRAGNAIAYQTGERKDLNLDRVVDEVCKERGYDFSSLFE